MNRSTFLITTIVAAVVAVACAKRALAVSYTIADLGTFSGTTSNGWGINASGRVAGYSDTTGGAAQHEFLYDGTMHDLGTLGGTDSYGEGINASGQVVGYSSTTGTATAHAFRYGANDGMVDLNLLIDPLSGRVLGEGWDINDLGQITGSGTIGGQIRAFLLTPVPAPSTLMLAMCAAIGLLTITCRRRRRAARNHIGQSPSPKNTRRVRTLRMRSILTVQLLILGLSLTANHSFAGMIAAAKDTDGGAYLYGTNGAIQSFVHLPSGNVSSLDYDPTNGNLYIAATSGMYERTPAGVLTLINNNYSYPPGNGIDIAVSPLGVIAVASDSAGGAYIYAANGALQSFIPLNGGTVTSLDYDPTNGNLYMAATTGLYERTPAGVLTHLNSTSFAPGIGIDIAVSPLGVIAVASDSAGGAYIYATNGALQSFIPLNGSTVTSLDYDSANGNLYLAATSGLYERTPAGVLTQLNGIAYQPGHELVIAVTPTPEPSTFVLAAFGMLGLAALARRRRRG